MSVSLPASPRPIEWTPELVSLATDLKSPSGGMTQRVFRPGDCWAITLTFYKARMNACGREWASKVMLATRSTAVWTLPPPKDGVGTPGAPVVNGGGQAGMLLNLRGLTAGYAFKPMQWISLFVGGRYYLHMVTAAATANGSGNVQVGILPMMRVSPPDGATVDVAAPKIEGLIPPDQALNISKAGLIDFSGKLTITENR